jgi:hypothetical protein
MKRRMQWIRIRVQETLNTASLRKKQKQFLLMLIIIIVLLESVFYFKNDVISNYLYFSFGLIALFTLVIFLIPNLFKWPFFIWLCIGLIMSEISSFIIFGVLYFIIFFPIRLIRGNKTIKGGWMKPADNTTMKEQF